MNIFSKIMNKIQNVNKISKSEQKKSKSKIFCSKSEQNFKIKTKLKSEQKFKINFFFKSEQKFKIK
jgi:hypothetical protein